MRVARIALLLAALVLPGRELLAQSVTGSVAGIVSSSSGIGLPGATVTVSDPTAGIERTVTTGADGEYLIEGLAVPGPYDLRAELAGFVAVTRRGVVLASGVRGTVSFLLLPMATETVSVVGRLPSRDQQQRSTIQQTIADRLAHSVPLIGRDFIALASLTPGFTGNPVAPSPNGQIYWANNIIVDGASHFSKWRSTARTFYSGYSLEAIQDVQVMNSQFAPEYGEALSSITSAVTRSGTNEPHGSALFFGQAGTLNDQPVFSARKPPASSARFGASIGGPIVRDQAFYFASYEGHRGRSNNIVVSPAEPQQAVPDNEDEHLAFVKVDKRLGSNDLITARYNGQWFDWHDEFGGLWLKGSGIKYRNDVHTGLVNITQIVSMRVLNQARFQVARYTDERTDLNPSVYVQRAGYSADGGTLGPYGFGASPENTYEGADALSYTAGRHAMKFGGGFKAVRAHTESLPYGWGAYYFAGPPSLFPQPYAFAQGVAAGGGTVTEPHSLSSFGFLQDEWRASPRVTLNYGLRYDIEQISNVRGYGATTDGNNLQPRVSAAWTPFGSRITVRGGAGLYTQQHLLYYVSRAQLEGVDGAALVTLTPSSPVMPIYPATVSASVLSQIPRDIFVVDPTFRNPYSVQAAIGATTTMLGFDLSADYVYLAGHDLMSIVDSNAPASVSKPVSRTVAQADATRLLIPGPGGYRKIITLGNEGRSWYRGLQIKANRTAGAFLLVSSYTLSRARDMANYVLPEDSRDIRAEIARADNDVRHNVAAGLTWQVPWDVAGGGWTLSAAGQFRSNRPFNITWGDDRDGTTQNDARPGGRNTGQTGAYRTIDMALAKRIPFGGRTLELRLEAFNILSTTDYDEYVGALTSPFFGQPITAFPKRRLQFAAVVRF